MNMKKRSIFLTVKQAVFLEKEAARLGIRVSDLIRRIIDNYRGRIINHYREPK
jgi:hypothetical protein